MLRKTNNLKGFTLLEHHGDNGRVKDLKGFYFDEESWTVRYLVAASGKWQPSRQVLSSPFTVWEIHAPLQRVEVDLAIEQIENSPSIDRNKPVARQFEQDYDLYYQRPYWAECMVV